MVLIYEGATANKLRYFALDSIVNILYNSNTHTDEFLINETVLKMRCNSKLAQR